MNVASRNRVGLDRRDARTPAARSSSTSAPFAAPQRLGVQVVAAKPSAVLP
jgi:hypothetical protein